MLLPCIGHCGSFTGSQRRFVAVYKSISYSATLLFHLALSSAQVSNSFRSLQCLFQPGGNAATVNVKQEAQLMLTTGSTRLAVSRGQQTWYHFGSIATFR